MPNQELHKDYPELMASYLSGNATEAEVQQLEAWVLEDPEHRRQFMAFKKAWILSGMKEKEAVVDVEDQWQETAAKLFAASEVVPMRPRVRTFRKLGIAASLALLVALSVWAWFRWTGEQEVYFAALDKVETVELPDGSTVILNRYASLRYTPEAAERESGQPARRSLSLEGDAFFDVAREVDRPFIIRSENLEVEVLGTSFYVDARPDQPEVQVIVESGLVAVRAADNPSVQLEAGQKGVYEKARDSLYQQSNEDANFQSIKTNTLQFDDSTLEQIAFDLSRHYGVEIDYSGIGDSRNCSLDGTYPDYALEDILLLIRETWGIETEVLGDRVLLSGPGCN